MTDSDYTQELPEVYSVHPAADAYPMLPTAELEQLAYDIKTNGQLDSIILTTDSDGEPVLIDGRNRLAACGIAEVHPVIEWVDFDSDDQIKSFVLSKNESRRHLLAGQRALAVAMIYPEATKNKKAGANPEIFRIDDSQLAKARLINQYAPHLIPDVMLPKPNGPDDPIPMRFSAALDQAKVIRKAQTEKPGQHEKAKEYWPEINDWNTDRAEKMLDGDIDPEEALRVTREEKETEEVKLRVVADMLKSVSTLSLGLCNDEAIGRAVTVINKRRDLLDEFAETSKHELLSSATKLMGRVGRLMEAVGNE